MHEVKVFFVSFLDKAFDALVITMAVRGSLLTFWMHVFVNINSDVEFIVEQKFNFLIRKSIKVGLVKSFPATALQFFSSDFLQKLLFYTLNDGQAKIMVKFMVASVYL